MSDASLERAKKSLRISDVYLRSGNMAVADTYDHRTGLGDNFAAQFRHVVSKSEMLVAESGDEAKRYFRVFIDLGYRWGTAEGIEGDADLSNSAGDHFAELGRIEGTYIAEYEVTEDLPEECLETFALKNASYHVWPFWREFVASACTRLNVPKQILPMNQFAQNRSAGSSEKDE